MKLIAKGNFRNTHSLILTPEAPQLGSVVKIIGGGNLFSNGADRRLLLRINGANDPYRNFVELRGDAAHNENDADGFYIGRNGYGEDAMFSFEYTLTVIKGMQRITGFGMATYAQAGSLRRFYTFQGHGVLDRVFEITSLELFCNTSSIDGAAAVYSIPVS